MKVRSISMLLAVLLGAVSSWAVAQDYPSRPVRVVVPYAAGGPTDVIARTVAQKMSENTGRSFLVENKVGAGTLIGTREVALSPPDGYTVLVASPTVAVLPLMSRSAGYKNEDLVAVAGLSNAPWFFAVPKGIPANTMTEFIAYAKANQGKLNIGIIGIGSSSHLLTQRFKVATGVDMTEVPYNGSALVMKDLMGGTVQAVIDGAATSLAAFKSGQAKLLATTSDKRQPNAPDVPTFRELGYPKIVATAWFGMFAPSKTPSSIRQRLGAEAIKALTDQAVKDRLIATGGVPWAGTTEEFIAFLAQDFPNWEEDAKRSGLKTD